MPSEEALGPVRQTVEIAAIRGHSMLRAVLRALPYWPAPASGMADVDVAIADGGLGIRSRRGLLNRDSELPDVRLAWGDIRGVSLYVDILGRGSRLSFWFPGGKGFTLFKALGYDNLTPIISALDAHGIVIRGRRLLTFPTGSPSKT